MNTLKTVKRLTVEEYLRLEQHSDVRHEYVRGMIHSMAGNNARHNVITMTIASLLRAHLKGTPFTVFMSDMKVRVDHTLYYPDVIVMRSPVDPHSLFQKDPVLIIEVLSECSETRDRLEKLVLYQSIPSVVEYVLVSQERVEVDVYRRDECGWELESLSGGDALHLTSVSYHSAVEALYDNI